MVASRCLHHDEGHGQYFSFHSSLVSFGFAGTDTMVYLQRVFNKSYLESHR